MAEDRSTEWLLRKGISRMFLQMSVVALWIGESDLRCHSQCVWRKRICQVVGAVKRPDRNAIG